MTQHNSPEHGPWALAVYSGACEAVMVRQGPVGPRTGGTSGPALDPARAAAEAARRARAIVRRTAGEHKLDRLWTLTFRSACRERCDAVKEYQTFMKRLQRKVGAVKAIAVPELHPGGHGWHVHIAIDRFLPKLTVATAWGHGFVDARRLKAQGGRPAATAGRYIAKYLTKDAWADPAQRGTQRYLKSAGLVLVPYRARAMYPADLLAVVDRMKGPVPYVFEWTSLGMEDWRGPPAWFAMW